MPRSSYGQCPNSGRGESGACVQVVGKTEFVTSGLWRPTCSKRDGRSVYLKEVGEMTFLRMHWQLVKEADGRKHLDMSWKSGPGPGWCRAFHSPKSTEVRGKNRSASAIILICARSQREGQHKYADGTGN